MKRISYLFLAVIFLLPAGTFAQISLGAYGGIHSNRVKIRGIAEEWKPNNRSLVTVNAGIFAEIPLLNGFSFQPGLGYIEKGFKVNISTEDFDLGNIPVVAGAEAIPRLQYLELPLLLKYTYGDGYIKPYFFIGPHVSYAMDGYVDFRATAIVTFKLGRSDINLDNDIYNRWELGGIAGLGARFASGPVDIFVQGSFQHGFTDMLETPIVDIRLFNYGYNLTAGVQYAF